MKNLRKQIKSSLEIVNKHYSGDFVLYNDMVECYKNGEEGELLEERMARLTSIKENLKSCLEEIDELEKLYNNGKKTI